MGKDLVTSPYGRFFYLPYYLAKQGHEVHILLQDYSNGDPLDLHAHGLRWISVPSRLHRPAAYLSAIRRLAREAEPDWLIGMSDTYYGILARYYGKRYGIRSCIDAYDNYESYIPWLIPLHWLWRRSLQQADLLTAAGPGLAELMSAGRTGKPAVVVPMAADPVGFEPMEMSACRRQMGLPENGKLIGYCGSMHKSRGVETLFNAFNELRKQHPDVVLVHSGRTWKNVPLPPWVHSLGYIDDEKMPVLLNCMNALVVTNRATSFGNHSYPVKLYEAMACKTPVVVTRTPATEWILGTASKHLVPPGDPAALGRTLEWAMQQESVDYGDVPDWKSSSGILERVLLGGGSARI